MALRSTGYHKIAAIVLLTLVSTITLTLASTMARYNGQFYQNDDLVAMESRGREEMEANVMTPEGCAVSTSQMWKLKTNVLPENTTTVARLTSKDAVTIKFNNMKTAATAVSSTVTPLVSSAVSRKISATTEAPKSVTSTESSQEIVDNFQVKRFGASIFGPLTTTTTVVPTVAVNTLPITFRPLVHIANKINRHRVHQNIIQRLDQLIAQGLTTTITTTTTMAPTIPTVAPTIPTVAPTIPTVAPTIPTVAPTIPTVAPTIPTVAPTIPTVAPTIPTVAPTVPIIVPTL